MRLSISGDVSTFPDTVRTELKKTIEETSHCNKLILNLALGYSGRYELVRAMKLIAHDVKRGVLDPDVIDEKLIGSKLFTTGLPDPDLIIRTSGEYRLSNFLLWQCSYSELYFTNVLWPEFTEEELHKAIKSYQKRDRRYGGLSGQG